MGIFDGIKKVINEKIIEPVKKWWNVQKLNGCVEKFNKYLRQVDSQLSYTIEIADIPAEYGEYIYQFKIYLANNPFVASYSSCVSQYDAYKSKISAHNKDVKKIITAANEFNKLYDSILDNPHLHKQTEVYTYYSEYQIALSYPNKTNNIKEFVTQYEAIKDDFFNIVAQYDCCEKAEQLLVLEDVYYDANRVSDLQQRLKDVLSGLSKVLYYEFPTNQDVVSATDAHNKQFVDRHLNDEVFNDVLGYALDIDQKIAVLQDENTSLVIAGAGSGKTLTVCGKLKYLLSLGVDPKEVLLLTFSDKSKQDLEVKAKQIDTQFEASTFHALGLLIIKDYTGDSFVVETQFNSILEEYFTTEVANNPDLQQNIIEYYGLYSASIDEHEKYKVIGDFFKAVKKSDFKTLKSMVDADKKTTIKKEIVKSYEELVLANFYFIYGINYEYEKPYKHTTATPDKRDYCPDFYLTDYDIYHEHYGIDKNNQCTQFCEEEAQNYLAGIEWKRALHAEKQTECIETYSYQFADGSIFNSLKEILLSKGVKFSPLSADEIWNKMQNIINDRDFTSFKNLIRTFTSLYKSMYSDETMFDKLLDVYAGENFTVYDRMRAQSLLTICKSFYVFYRNKLKYITVEEDREKIDFDDMILLAIKYLPSMETYKYKYIVVDEFQDISHSRMRFLNALKKQCNSKMFLVGDDWQSIYRFAGSDIDIFINAEKYFGKTATSVISTTYRNSQELVDIASRFIMANDEQVKKTIRAVKSQKEPIRICYFHKNKLEAFNKALQEIALEIKPQERILVLGRNRKDVESILTTETKYREGVLVIPGFERINIRYSTVHASKGLEFDYVILINGDDDRMGFPNKIEDDKILSLVLAEESDFLYAEERRLFYVALTRTKKTCYILSDSESTSEFVKEIEKYCRVYHWEGEQYNEHQVVLCPYCMSGKIIKRTERGSNRSFYGCSNYPLCNYTNDDTSEKRFTKKCPRCGDYMRVKKNRSTGNPFWGCNSYSSKTVARRCNYTEQIDTMLDKPT